MKTTRNQNLLAAAEAASHEATLDLDQPSKEKAMEPYRRLEDLMVYQKLYQLHIAISKLNPPVAGRGEAAETVHHLYIAYLKGYENETTYEEF